MSSVRRNFARDNSHDFFRPDRSELGLTMILLTVGHQGCFGKMTTGGRNSVYTGREDRHEHWDWFPSV